MAYEICYSKTVSHNFTITAAFFSIEQVGSDEVTVGLVKTTFSF